MKKITIVLTALLLIQSITLTAQLERQNGLSITLKGPNTKIEGVTAVDASAKTQHLRFLSEGYKKAKLNELKDEFLFRYNIFADEMEFIKDGKIYFLSKTKNQTITFLDLNRTFKVIELDGKLQYLEINYNGKVALYTKQSVIYKEGKVATTQFETSKKSKFIKKKDEHYITIDNSEIIKLPKGKKDFYALFGEKSNAIKKYAKNEKISRKKVTDIIQILKHYNSI